MPCSAPDERRMLSGVGRQRTLYGQWRNVYWLFNILFKSQGVLFLVLLAGTALVSGELDSEDESGNAAK